MPDIRVLEAAGVAWSCGWTGPVGKAVTFEESPMGMLDISTMLVSASKGMAGGIWGRIAIWRLISELACVCR